MDISRLTGRERVVRPLVEHQLRLRGPSLRDPVSWADKVSFATVERPDRRRHVHIAGYIGAAQDNALGWCLLGPVGACRVVQAHGLVDHCVEERRGAGEICICKTVFLRAVEEGS